MPRTVFISLESSTSLLYIILLPKGNCKNWLYSLMCSLNLDHFIWTETETSFAYSLLTFHTFGFQIISLLMYSKDVTSTGDSLPQTFCSSQGRMCQPALWTLLLLCKWIRKSQKSTYWLTHWFTMWKQQKCHHNFYVPHPKGETSCTTILLSSLRDLYPLFLCWVPQWGHVNEDLRFPQSVALSWRKGNYCFLKLPSATCTNPRNTARPSFHGHSRRANDLESLETYTLQSLAGLLFI